MSREFTCNDCGFVTGDIHLMGKHSCDVALNSGRCEDYPACGHEYGDCNGLLYGSDESIKEQVYRDWNTGHGYCDHESGLYNCEFEGADDYEAVEDCIANGHHLKSVDRDGYCNYCGESPEDDDYYDEDEMQADISDRLAYE